MVARIVVIGGGPAGYEAALVAAAHGRDVTQVTVVDSDGVGGACVLYDCVPSKTLIASTGVRTELRLLGVGRSVAQAERDLIKTGSLPTVATRACWIGSPASSTTRPLIENPCWSWKSISLRSATAAVPRT